MLGVTLREIVWRATSWMLEPLMAERPAELAVVGDRVNLPGEGHGIVVETWGTEGDCAGWAEVRLDGGTLETSRRERLEKL